MNPFAPASGLADPHVRVFQGRVFLYTGTDDDPEGRDWVMRRWRIFSSGDLKNWRSEGEILPRDTYMGEGSPDCWAGDVAEREGRYYFYFSDRSRGIGVMVADRPEGPFRDPVGKPLLEKSHDPTVLVEKDASRTAWLVSGSKERRGYTLARLREDMMGLAEDPKPITIRGREWEEAPSWMDKNYLFCHEGIYYLSWGRDYAVSDCLAGPYDSVGPVAEGEGLSEYAHGSFFQWKEQWYHIWCRYCRPGYKFRELVLRPCEVGQGKIKTLVDCPVV
ncbi:MAG: family 43 glycosylhydrolase [Opitutales bacterium]|nr:family 43 glycosylhydrolase [Opitutales bacterium]